MPLLLAAVAVILLLLGFLAAGGTFHLLGLYAGLAWAWLRWQNEAFGLGNAIFTDAVAALVLALIVVVLANAARPFRRGC